MERSGLMSMSSSPQSKPGERVGPVLIRGPVADALVLAIRALNEEVEVVDRGAYLRVLVPGHCRLSRAAAEARLGASFHLPADLEEVMPSFKGRLFINEEEAIWRAGSEQ
jgi:hypothetical protein